MARNTHGTRSELVHCDNCGADYSVTYKRCPFCGARPENQGAGRLDLTGRLGAAVGGGRRLAQEEAPRRPPRAQRPPAQEDDYVFDGGDVFDDKGGGGEDGRGGKRLAVGGLGVSPATLISLVCSGVIVVAAMLIVFLVILPMIRSGSIPTAENDPNKTLTPPTSASPSDSASPSPSGPASPDPSGGPGGEDDPAGTSPSPVPTPVQPSPSPSAVQPSPSPSAAVPSGMSLNYSDITISPQYPNPVQLQARGATGTVSWSSSNTAAVTVSAAGVVTAVGRGQANITATDGGGRTATCRVISTINAGEQGTQAPAASAEPSASSAPASAPASGGLTLSRTDFTLNDTWPTYTFTVTGASGGISWSTSDASVATVDANGKVTKVGRGQCRVTAVDGNGQSASCIVRCS